MSTKRASPNDHKGPQPKQSLSTRPGKMILIKKPRPTESSGVETHTPLPKGREQEGNTKPASGVVQSSMTDRAFGRALE